MPSIFYGFREDGTFGEIYRTDKPSASAYVIDDTMAPLKNLVTDKIYDSKSSYIKDCKALGLEIVGNDLLSKRPEKKRDRITDAMVMEKIQHAEAILSDPTKKRAFDNRNRILVERHERLVHGRI